MSPTFADLGVPPHISRALAASGITQPFAIQAATIADALAGRDVCGRAPTGSGKTLAFGIPLVATVGTGVSRRPRGLVLAPTRELADQIASELASFAGDIRIGVVYGGVGYGPQVKALRRGVDVVVACPGRLEDLIGQGDVDLSDVDIVVIDEADRMADMGFLPAVRRLLDQTSHDRQTVLFSATLDGDIKTLTEQYQQNPVRHEVGEETPDITAASHLFWKVEGTERIDVTAAAVQAAWPAIVFCRTRHGSDRLAKQLGKRGVKAAAIHGGRSQAQRTRALADFTKGKVEALVATDVAARGIHVDGVAAVVQFDPPEDHKTYIHRSGRTARAGEGGIVISLVQPAQVKESRKMQRRADLDEDYTAPDPASLRDLAPGTPKRSPAPSHTGGSGRADDNPNRAPSTGGENRSHSGGGRARKPKNRHDSTRRTSGAQASGRGSRERSDSVNGTATKSSSKPGRTTSGRHSTASSAVGSESHGGGERRPTKARSKGSSPGNGGGSARRRSKGQPEGRATGPSKNGAKATSGSSRSTKAKPTGGSRRPNRKARRAHLQRPG